MADREGIEPSSHGRQPSILTDIRAIHLVAVIYARQASRVFTI